MTIILLTINTVWCFTYGITNPSQFLPADQELTAPTTSPETPGAVDAFPDEGPRSGVCLNHDNTRAF